MDEIKIKTDYRSKCYLCGNYFDTPKEFMCHLRDEHYLKRRRDISRKETIDFVKKIISNVLEDSFKFYFYNKHRVPFSQSTIDKIAEILRKTLNMLGSIRFGVIFSDYSLEKPIITKLSFNKNSEIIMPFHIICREFDYSESLDIYLYIHTGRYSWEGELRNL